MERDSKINKSLDELVNEDKKLSKMSGSFNKRKDDRRGGGASTGGGGGSSLNRQRDRSVSNDKRRGSPSCRVFVSNLSFETNWKSLKDHMRKVGDVVRADIFEDDRGRSRGIGIVEFRSSTDAQRAIRELHNGTLDGRVIYVREDEDHNTPAGGSGRSGAAGDRDGRGDRTQGQGAGMSSAKRIKRSRSRSLSIQKRDDRDRKDDKNRGKLIFVGNLPYSVSKHQLKEAFKDFGTILYTDVMCDERGKSKGFGQICFESKKSAEEAIKVMDQARFNDRVVNVRWDRNS